MTRFLPDSNVLIRYARGEQRESDWFRSVLNTYEEVGTCVIVVTECLAGAHPPERPGWKEVFSALEHWTIEVDDALLAGTWAYDYARQGRRLAATDLLIAAVAKRVGAIVVTDNIKDFPMDDVAVQRLG